MCALVHRVYLAQVEHVRTRLYLWPMDRPATLGAMLAQLRARKDGLSIRKAAKLVGVSATWWTRLEKDDPTASGPGPKLLLRIGEEFEVSHDELGDLFRLSGQTEFWETVLDTAAVIARTSGAPLEAMIEHDPALDSEAKHQLKGALRAQRARMAVEADDES